MTRARFWDIAAASPLIVLYAFALAGLALEVRHDLEQISFSLRAGTALVAHFASALFVSMQIALFLVRKLPIARLQGIARKTVVIVGANSGLLYYLLPRADPHLAMPSAILTTLGMMGSVFVLSYLGRAFSILPQARALVMTRPYRIVRHPLYLAEQLSSLGIMLQFAQPWSFFVFLAGFALQWPRMIFEERILAQTFPEYRAYAASTPRIIPGVC